LDSASPWRWHASFSIFREYQTTPKPMPHKGSILLHVETKHVVLVDIDEKVVDARYLKEGESINPGSVFNFAQGSRVCSTWFDLFQKPLFYENYDTLLNCTICFDRC
jgi:hypothetical protein